MNELADIVTQWFDPEVVGAFVLAWSGRLIAALVIFLVGRLVARWLSRGSSHAMLRVGPDPTLGRFFGNVAYTGLLSLATQTASK